MIKTRPQRGKRWPLMHAVLAFGGEPSSHKTLAAVAGVGTRTVSSVLREIGPDATRLLESGPVRFGPGAGLALGLSVGSQSVRGALVDANGELHHRTSAEPLAKQLDLAPDDMFRRVKAVAATVLEKAISDESLCISGGSDLGLLGAVVAWPSPLDREKRPKGFVLRDQAWRETDEHTGEARSIPERISETLGDPFTPARCHAVHDVNAHGLCVAFHESRARTIDPNDTSSMWRVGLVLRVGEGLGVCSMLLAPPHAQRLSFIDSKLIEGTKGLAGELGHLHVDRQTIVDINKNPVEGLAAIDYEKGKCSCGNKHHLESFASAPALLRRLEASRLSVPQDGPSQERLLVRAREGQLDDPLVLRAGTDIGRILGRALAGPVLLLNPSGITLTGPLASTHLVSGVVRAGDAWVGVMEDSVKVGLDETSSGDYIGVKGAGLALIRQLVYRDFLDKRVGNTPATFRLSVEDVDRLR
jgi:predicted NBD/HSP70 family sugar kinase